MVLADSVACSCMCARQGSNASLYVGVRECLRVFASPSSSRRCRRRLRRFRGPRPTAGAATAYAVYVPVSVPVYVACTSTCANIFLYTRPPIV